MQVGAELLSAEVRQDLLNPDIHAMSIWEQNFFTYSAPTLTGNLSYTVWAQKPGTGPELL